MFWGVSMSDSCGVVGTNQADAGRRENFPRAVEVRRTEVSPREDRRSFLIRLTDLYGKEDCVCMLSRTAIQELRHQIDAALVMLE